MTEGERQTAATKLRLIAAIAADMAQKVERGQTWPGDVADAKQQIAGALAELRAQ